MNEYVEPKHPALDPQADTRGYYARPVGAVKTLDEVKADLSRLYDELRDGRLQREDAAEMANIAGKFIRADALLLAREMFASGTTLRRIGHK
jgi:hypothetical protein